MSAHFTIPQELLGKCGTPKTQCKRDKSISGMNRDLPYVRFGYRIYPNDKPEELKMTQKNKDSKKKADLKKTVRDLKLDSQKSKNVKGGGKGPKTGVKDIILDY
jgi:hypothetical protein